MKYIWLCIELLEYDCPQCNIFDESDDWHESNMKIIEKSIRELFLILSTWEPSGNLTLDISVYSKSDTKHYFKYLHIGSDAIPESDNDRKALNMHDPDHGWTNGELVSLPSDGSILRLYEDIEIALDFWQELPEVPVVTSLLLRRQTRRRWEARTLEKLFKLLPRLHLVFYEPWREWGRVDQRETDKGNFSSITLNMS